MLIGCSISIKSEIYNFKNSNSNNICSIKSTLLWLKIINKFSRKYHIDWKLITSIICVESSGNTKVISRSKAVGLMQIKPCSAGREVYRFRGWLNQPSNVNLYDPTTNIDIGTSYISILEKKFLAGIHNLEILRYATVVSYVNGASKLLKSLSWNKKLAIQKINKMKIIDFLNHVKKKHPDKQAWKYLNKIMIIYYLL